MAMRTLGVDLASQPKGTALCTLEWKDGACRVLELRLGADNETILRAARGVDRVAIDAPVGWPRTFVSLLRGEYALETWNDATRDALRFRHTDAFVRACTGRWPLSVSSDLIGVVALRCQTLLPSLKNVDEAYPAAALARWLGKSLGYKGKEGHPRRKAMLKGLLVQAPFLTLSTQERRLCEAEADVFDALVVALVARAASLGLTEPVPEALREEVRLEGWIAVPKEGSLALLGLR